MVSNQYIDQGGDGGETTTGTARGGNDSAGSGGGGNAVSGKAGNANGGSVTIISDGGNIDNNDSNFGGNGGTSTSGDAIGGNDRRKRSPEARLTRLTGVRGKAAPAPGAGNDSGDATTGDSDDVSGGDITVAGGGGNVHNTDSSMSSLFCTLHALY